MAKKQTPKSTIVGSPLTPELLKELGAVDEFPATPKEFDPQANWVNTYRIWTCHGFRETGNQNVGFVRFERLADKLNAAHTLKIHQEVAEADGIVNVIDAEIQCQYDQLASPVRWRLSSRFIGPNGHSQEELSIQEKAQIEGNIVILQTGSRTLRRKVPSRLTCDYSIFEAVQRMKFDKETSLSFDMLEGLSLLKQGQQLSYRSAYQMNLSSNNVSLHRFDQLGDGILPCEYWLDNNHRLIVVTSMNKAYILDEQAEKKIRRRIEQLRKSYRKSKSAVRK
jgi:hypothetical protein